MAKREFSHPNEMHNYVGQEIGVSDWVEVTQERIDQFAEATGDRQWIHVDPERAKDGPFGATIAHGYLTMSLSNHFLPQIVRVDGISMGVNYGVNKVRFPAPVPVGSKVRAGAELAAVEDVKGGVQTTMVISLVSRTPPPFMGSAAISLARARTFDPAGTGLVKRTLLQP